MTRIGVVPLVRQGMLPAYERDRRYLEGRQYPKSVRSIQVVVLGNMVWVVRKAVKEEMEQKNEKGVRRS
jgi:hypothetical protein